MHFPLTRMGLPQVLVCPLFTLLAMALLFVIFRPAFWIVVPEIALFLIFLWMISFFRDPQRHIVPNETLLYSPADGTVTDIDIVEESELGCRAVRIGIFLSIFNVHINRAPCSARIDDVRYKKGAFKYAAAPEAGSLNEANSVFMTRLAVPKDTLLVRQVSGVAARHIVCKAKPGDSYRQGDRFGMIKFGSRAELYVPAPDAVADGGGLRAGAFDILVKKGDIVRAGLTPLVGYKTHE